jgi:hypothetical protein
MPEKTSDLYGQKGKAMPLPFLRRKKRYEIADFSFTAG